MQVRFTKMHGAGNDFVVIDATAAPFRPTPSLLQRLADRRFGVGCDQILVVEPPASPDVDFNYRIYNADGSESGQCGNGARAGTPACTALQLLDLPHDRLRAPDRAVRPLHPARRR